LLVQEVVTRYAGKARFVSENFGASALADRFGVTRYPAVFVDDVLVARPRDFGFVGKGESAGRYAPWRDAASQEKFKADLSRMIDLVLAGKHAELESESRGAAPDAGDVASMPPFSLTDFSGRPLAASDLAGRVVVVEFWATWCPPCRSTLEWLGGLRQKYGDRLAVVALAVESPEPDARALAAKIGSGVLWAMTDGATAHAFGDIAAVPTLFVFDRAGKTARVVYGAPPDLHAQVENSVAQILR
jgi:thiol-disulfide isomerase/thioredoxin